MISPSRLLLLLACAAIAGCTYLEARDNTRPGGLLDQQQEAANAALKAENERNEALRAAKLQRERELDRQDRRVQALQQQMRDQDDALQAARKANRITQAKYQQLKKELDSARSQAQEIEKQNQGDRGTTPSAATADADRTKERRLVDLENRKKALETALAGMTKN